MNSIVYLLRKFKFCLVVVRLDNIVVGALQNKMVTVKASDMETAIDEKGSISLFGILFDFNTSDIKPESRPTLDEIGKLLRGSPDRKSNACPRRRAR